MNTYNDPPMCVSEMHNQMNQKTFERNIPSHTLQPYLDVRPASTKYSYFPVVEPRTASSVSVRQMPAYEVGQVFNPGTSRAPWSGFVTHVNVESELRGQVFALQKCSQATYVPQSNSDLYEYRFQTPVQPNPHELLFRTETFAEFNPNPSPSSCGVELFNNNTRCQIKELTKPRNK